MNDLFLILPLLVGLFLVYVSIDMALDWYKQKENLAFKDISNKVIAAEDAYVYAKDATSYWQCLNDLGLLPKTANQVENVMLFENYNYFGRIFEAKTQIKIDDSYRTLNMVGISVEYKNILVPHIEIKPLAFLVDFPTKLNLRRAKKLDAFIDKNFALFHGVKTEVGSELNSFLGKEGIGQFIWKNGFCMAACNESTLILYRKGEIQALKNEYDQLRGEIDYLANIFLNSTGVKSKSHKAS